MRQTISSDASSKFKNNYNNDDYFDKSIESQDINFSARTIDEHSKDNSDISDKKNQPNNTSSFSKMKVNDNVFEDDYDNQDNKNNFVNDRLNDSDTSDDELDIPAFIRKRM
jgi:hypothetical protein